MKRIDFSASYLTWMTRQDGSYGRFHIEAACTIRDLGSKKTETYYLAPAIIAGNVYAKDDLVKQPTYLFQIAASEDRYVIFRTYMGHIDGQSNFGLNSDLFEEVELQITKKDASLLKEFDSIDLHFQKHDPISACMSYETRQNCQVEIEFPVRHINIQRKKRLFQVETGPILIPLNDTEDQLFTGHEYSFNTAFVHFNRLDRAEITLNLPSCVGVAKKNSGSFSQIKKLMPQIVLMADNDRTEQ